jgi:hypothetical protein
MGFWVVPSSRQGLQHPTTTSFSNGTASSSMRTVPQTLSTLRSVLQKYYRPQTDCFPGAHIVEVKSWTSNTRQRLRACAPELSGLVIRQLEPSGALHFTEQNIGTRWVGIVGQTDTETRPHGNPAGGNENTLRLTNSYPGAFGMRNRD